MLRVLLLPMVALVIWSCAPISEDQCRGGDWGSIGLKDGKAGRDLSYLNLYRETCAEFGISPDQETYLEGRKAGLTFYCTPQNAYSVGREGNRLKQVCAPGIQQSMIPAYEKGRQYYEIVSEIDRLRFRIDEIRKEQRRIAEQEIADNGQISGVLLGDDIDDLRSDIFLLQLQLDRYASYP